MARRWRAIAASLALLAAPAAALTLSGAPAGALTTIPVTTASDAAIRAAFTTANATNDDVVIELQVGSATIDLTGGVLTYTGGTGGAHTLTVEGNGATIDQQTAGAGVFDSTSSNATGLTLDGLTITGGTASGHGGAALLNQNLVITNSTVTGNTGAFDIIDARNVTLTNDTFTNNSITATGATACDGIIDTDVTVVTSTHFSGNTCTATGSGEADGTFDTTTTTLTNSSVIGDRNVANTGVAEGTVFPTGLTMTGSVLQNDTNSSTSGDASGIINSTPTTITGSSIVGNTNSTTTGGEADATVFPTTLTVTNSTIANNSNSAGTGSADGGGVESGQDVRAVNSTVADNTTSGARTFGGGILQGSPGAGSQTAADGKHPAKGHVGAAASLTTTLVYTTIVGNTAATGANLDVGQIVPFGSVVAEPQGGANCVTTTTTSSQGFNFSDDGSCGFTAATDHPKAGSPVLGALADNGGPGPTLLPLTGSPLIDGVAAGSCQADGAAGITTDERGLPRPDSASPACDIGAVEVQPSTTIVAAFTG